VVEQLNTLIDTLSLDHRRGAAEIVRDAADLFISIAVVSEESPISSEHLFERAVKRLAKGQPTMAPVLNLLNRICLAKSEADDDWERFADLVRNLAGSRSDLIPSMANHLGELPAVTDTLIAFSNSSTVAALVTAAHTQLGWPRAVYCGEGRPVMEGLVMAHKLMAAGLEVTVFTDAALMSRIVEAQAVWIGGDSLSCNGLVNKVGSRALAMLAKFRGIPFVSMMGTDKFLSRGMTPYFGFLPQNPREIGADDAESLCVHNEYYETIPVDLISIVLTENGPADPARLVESIAEEPFSPLLASLLQG
jgi:translation initiation factor eIF-2B subunit delta